MKSHLIKFSYNEGNGHATIWLDRFLPTNQKRFTKLIRMIDLDYEHYEELRGQIADYIKERTTELREEIGPLENRLNEIRDYSLTYARGDKKKASELEDEIGRKKRELSALLRNQETLERTKPCRRT